MQESERGANFRISQFPLVSPHGLRFKSFARTDLLTGPPFGTDVWMHGFVAMKRSAGGCTAQNLSRRDEAESLSCETPGLERVSVSGRIKMYRPRSNQNVPPGAGLI
jgi:hypothetical protein